MLENRPNGQPLEDLGIIRRFRKSLYHRELEITEEGRLELVPNPAKMGDEVFLLAGSPVSFILRSAGEGT